MSRRVSVALNMLSPYWHDVYDALGRRGWDIRIFVGTSQEPNRKYQQCDYSRYAFQVQTVRNMMVNMDKFRWRTSLFHIPIGLWNELARFRPNVIVSNELGARTMLCMLYGTAYNVPVIPWVCVTPHTERNNSALRETLRRRLVRKAPAICTNHTEARSYLTTQLGFASEKILSTPYAVDVKAYHARVMEDAKAREQNREKLHLKGTVLLYVGQMIPRKGLAQLISGLLLLTEEVRRGITLLTVGGEIPFNHRKTLQATGVHTVEIDFVQPSELHMYYNIADAFVFPTLEDEWGIVLNEACASGLPILTSRYAGAATDLLHDGVNGYGFHPDKENEIAEVISTFVALPDEKKKAMKQASLDIASRFDIHMTINNLEKALILGLGIHQP